MSLALQIAGSSWYEPDVAFYLMPTRAWELLVGVALCVLTASDGTAARLRAGPCRTRLIGRLRSTLARAPPVARALLLDALVCLLLGASFVLEWPATPGFDGHALFPVPLALPAVAGTACFILAGRHPTWVALPAGRRLRLPLLNALLGTAPCVYGGKLSYGMYLFHWPAIVLFRWTVGWDQPWMKAG